MPLSPAGWSPSRLNSDAMYVGGLEVAFAAGLAAHQRIVGEGREAAFEIGWRDGGDRAGSRRGLGGGESGRAEDDT